MLRSREFADTRPSLLSALDAEADGAWEEFFGLYAPAVYRVARLRGLAGDDAEDVVQQTMLAVLGHIDGFDYNRDRGRFRSWVRRIAENKVTDLLRARTRRDEAIAAASQDTSSPPDLDSAWRREWRRQDLRRCMEIVSADVTPRRMEAFRLYVVEGVTAAETARLMGMTIGAVYVARRVVIEELRRRMEALGDDGRGTGTDEAAASPGGTP